MKRWPWIAAVVAALGVGVAVGWLAAPAPEPEATTETATTEPEPVTVTETVTVTPTPAPEPESATLSIEQAAERYLEIVGPGNAASTEGDALYTAGRYREACETMIEPNRAALDLFAAEAWPGDVDRLIRDELIPLSEDEINAYESCASAPDDRAAEDIWYSSLYDAQEARAPVTRAVRTLLGLPQVN